MLVLVRRRALASRRGRAARLARCSLVRVNISQGDGQAAATWRTRRSLRHRRTHALFATPTTAGSDGAVTRARRFHAAGGAVPLLEHLRRGDDLRRGGRRACTRFVRDRARRLRRRVDDRANAGVPRQENRAPTSEARRARRCSSCPVLVLTLTPSRSRRAPAPVVFNPGAHGSPRRCTPDVDGEHEGSTFAGFG